MKKLIAQLVFIGLVFPIPTFADSNDDFKQMESQGIFKQIKDNFVASCYSRSASAVPTAKVNLEKLKIQYPERIKVCTCFKNELLMVSNRVIFEDSQKAYQHMNEINKARLENNAEKVKALTEKAQANQSVIAVIAKRCEAH